MVSPQDVKRLNARLSKINKDQAAKLAQKRLSEKALLETINSLNSEYGYRLSTDMSNIKKVGSDIKKAYKEASEKLESEMEVAQQLADAYDGGDYRTMRTLLGLSALENDSESFSDDSSDSDAEPVSAAFADLDEDDDDDIDSVPGASIEDIDDDEVSEPKGGRASDGNRVSEGGRVSAPALDFDDDEDFDIPAKPIKATKKKSRPAPTIDFDDDDDLGEDFADLVGNRFKGKK